MIAERPSPTTPSEGLVRRFPFGPSGAATTRPVLGLLMEQTSLAEAREAAKRSLQPLYDLEPGWDSYNGQPLDPRIGDTVEQMLAQMIFKKSELPVVVPKSTGGLALEWHRASRELAIELSTDGVMVFFCDPGTGEEWERSILDVQPPELVEAFTAIREG